MWSTKALSACHFFLSSRGMPESLHSARRERWREIVFEAETPAGRRFDVALLWLITLSVACVMLESVPAVRRAYARPLQAIEWGFTLLFTLEYFLRLYVVRHPLRYARSFYGIIDVLSVLPTYLIVFFPGLQA